MTFYKKQLAKRKSKQRASLYSAHIGAVAFLSLVLSACGGGGTKMSFTPESSESQVQLVSGSDSGIEEFQDADSLVKFTDNKNNLIFIGGAEDLDISESEIRQDVEFIDSGSYQFVTSDFISFEPSQPTPSPLTVYIKPSSKIDRVVVVTVLEPDTVLIFPDGSSKTLSSNARQVSETPYANINEFVRFTANPVDGKITFALVQLED